MKAKTKTKKTKTKRTYNRKPKLTLTIPARGREDLLRQTVEHAVAVAGVPIEVVIVDNGIDAGIIDGWTPPPCVRIVRCDNLGTGQARHAGMIAASCEVVATIDAHMRMGDGWARDVFEAVNGSPRTVFVGHVGALGDGFAPEGECGYHGARLRWMDDTAERRPLAAKWIREPLKGNVIGAPMGAFYVLTKTWYDAIKQPWARMSSWGCDEEVVALATACMGGDIRILPPTCRAWHRFGKAAVEYTQDQLREVAANRARLLHLFPFSSDEVDALSAWAGYSPEPPQDIVMDDDAVEFRDSFLPCRGRLVEYLSAWCEGYDEWRASRTARPTPRPIPQRLPDLPPRPREVCDQCDSVNSFRVTHSKPHLTYLRCRFCGRRAWRPRDGKVRYGILND